MSISKLKRIVVKTSITFKNPHVFEFFIKSIDGVRDNTKTYYEVVKFLKSNAVGSWGNSRLEWIDGHLKCLFCFENTEDILYLKMRFGQHFKSLKVWRSVDFTIFEMENNNVLQS